MRAALIFGGLAVALLGPAALVGQNEWVLATGTPVLLELAPVDPRSLMQGDYMNLTYSIAQWQEEMDALARDGHLVIALDENGVAKFVRIHTPETPLAPGELLLRYRVRNGRVRLGAEAFFFQEGHASRYVGARYGELRVAANWNSVLVGLRDRNRRPLGGEHSVRAR